MLRIARILFPTDFSACSNHAFPYAERLAQRYGAELHMLHALALHAADPADPAHRFPEVEEVTLGTTDGGDGAATTSGVRVFHAQQRGFSAASVILDYAVEHHIDLIVMGTHGRRGLRRFVMGSVAEEVVRFARCPVLTVREDEKTKTSGDFRRIVAPVDFSQHSRLAVSHARELASALKARLDLLHVVHEVVYPDFYFPSTIRPLGAQELREEAIRRLEALLESTEGPPVEGETAAVVGSVAHEIARYAKEKDADLIVIASHGLTGILDVLLGSVTERVVRQAPCSVLTLKATGKSLLEVGEGTGEGRNGRAQAAK
ncbi:MAG: universal stress protein [Gemmatimonadota bacterium]